MANREDKDSEQDISDNSIKKILLDEETQENQSKVSKDTKKKAKSTRLSTSHTLGSGSPVETRKKPKIIHTPPDATGFVRVNKKSGTLLVDTKAVSIENKKLKTQEGLLQDQIVALKAELDKYKNTGSQPTSSPASKSSDYAGLEGFLKSQYDDMRTFFGEQLKIYQDAQAATERLKLKKILDPTLNLEAPGYSRAASYQSALADKSSSKSSNRDIMGSLINERDGSGDELDITGSMDGHNGDIIG